MPPIRISPSSGCSKPAINRNDVVLPQPDGPKSDRNSPLRTFRLTESTAVREPKRLVTARSSTSYTPSLPGEITLMSPHKASVRGTVGHLEPPSPSGRTGSLGASCTLSTRRAEGSGEGVPLKSQHDRWRAEHSRPAECAPTPGTTPG